VFDRKEMKETTGMKKRGKERAGKEKK